MKKRKEYIRKIELTGKLLLFCKYYCDKSNKETYFNSHNSAIAAGYAKTSASQANVNILTKPHVKKYIDDNIERAKAIIESKFNITTVDIFERLDYIYNKCIEEQPILNKKGEIISYRIDAKNALTALHLMGRELGMFKDIVKVGDTKEFNLTIIKGDFENGTGKNLFNDRESETGIIEISNRSTVQN